MQLNQDQKLQRKRQLISQPEVAQEEAVKSEPEVAEVEDSVVDTSTESGEFEPEPKVEVDFKGGAVKSEPEVAEVRDDVVKVNGRVVILFLVYTLSKSKT